ncbi:hypothetical protein TIFTF001_038564 [Ficus carica]|uniref:Uncharacterized protein n=1 Tax=Ficus carica TaxID=3494 RepID=A0AA88JDY5_FICCA|nr:hypothetical protein TIFTF001_038564 [Ficus carica]
MYLPKMASRVLLLVLVGALICTKNYARKLQGGLGYTEGLGRWFEIGYNASIGAGGPGNAGVARDLEAAATTMAFEAVVAVLELEPVVGLGTVAACVGGGEELHLELELHMELEHVVDLMEFLVLVVALAVDLVAALVEELVLGVHGLGVVDFLEDRTRYVISACFHFHA